MSTVLGLMTTEQLQSKYSLNARRRVFYQYPNGAAPLMGLLSLMDTEETDKAQNFGWNEDRMKTHEYLTAQANAAGPFTATGTTTDKTTAGWGDSAGTVIRCYLADTDDIGVRDVLLFRNIPGTSSSEKSFQGIVTEVDATNDYVEVELTSTIANVLNTTAANGMTVVMVGSAVAEGDRSKRGFQSWPIEITNHTQIFRHAFDFSRTSLKAGLKFDSSGVYKTKAKKNSLKHMKALEYAALFGDKSLNTAATTDDSLDSTRRTMGGVLWFLKQWEIGNTTNGGAFDYRVGGSDVTSSAWATTDEKRIIDLAGANITKDQFDTLLERIFRFLMDGSFEVLCLCGSGFLQSFNKFVGREAIRTTKLKIEEAYGMEVTVWETIYGTIYFKTHPLLSQTAAYRNSAFFLDPGRLAYRPLNDSDTVLLRNRQPRDFDGRKDEWLTECGLELSFPESHMFIDRLGGISG